jgi:hypothetical protein
VYHILALPCSIFMLPSNPFLRAFCLPVKVAWLALPFENTSVKDSLISQPDTICKAWRCLRFFRSCIVVRTRGKHEAERRPSNSYGTSIFDFDLAGLRSASLPRSFPLTVTVTDSSTNFTSHYSVLLSSKRATASDQCRTLPQSYATTHASSHPPRIGALRRRI